MAVAFHLLRRLAESEQDELRKARPHLAPVLDDIRGSVANDDTRSSPQVAIHAISVVFRSPNLNAAVTRLSRQQAISPVTAQARIVQAVNAHVSVLGSHDEELYQKGLIRGPDKFYVTSIPHRPGTLFDKARQLVKENYRPILKAAIGQCYSPNPEDERISRSTLSLIAARLVEDKGQRTALIRAMASERPQKEVLTALKTADHVIAQQAQSWGIDVSTLELKPVPPAEQPMQEEVPACPKPQVRMQSTFNALAAEEELPSVDLRQLRRQLKALVDKGQLNPREARIYLALQSDAGSGEVARQFGVSVHAVERCEERIHEALDRRRADKADEQSPITP